MARKSAIMKQFQSGSWDQSRETEVGPANVVSFPADNGLTAAVAREGLHGSRGARRGGMPAVQVLLAGSNIPALAQSETTVIVLRPVSHSEHG